MAFLFGAGVNKTASWHPEPTFRGTYSILSSCWITLGLCIWTAMHLNIPELGKSSRQKWKKLGWFFLGVFAPEIVVWCAYAQLQEAKIINKEMISLLRQKEPKVPWQQRLKKWFNMLKIKLEQAWADLILLLKREKKPKAPLRISSDRPKWTMTHSHYVAMGGFVLEQRGNENTALPPDIPRLTLRLPELKFIAQCSIELIPRISKAQLKDKSKASGITKAIVCVQALWFCVQCVSRLAYGLSISLLELNTFAHCLCAFIMYHLWWDKPLDVEVPTRLKGAHLEEISAWFFLPKRIIDIYADVLGVEERNKLFNVPSAQRLDPALYGSESMQMRTLESQRNDGDPESHAALSEPSSLIDRRTWSHYCQSIPNLTQRESHLIQLSDNASAPDEYVFELLHRLSLSFYKTHISFGGRSVWRKRLLESEKKQYGLPPSISNFPKIYNLDYFDFKMDWRILITLGIAGLVYGGLHLSAWNAPFATLLEQRLWRVSAGTVAGSGLILPLALRDTSFVKKRWEEYLEVGFDGAICALCLCLPCLAVALLAAVAAYLFTLLYLLARIYLVVECYRNLVHLPPSAFQVPVWSRYFPHAGGH